MTKQRYWILPLLLYLPATLASAGNAVIEDFSEYSSAQALQQNWDSFGSAASSGPATLESGEGKSGSNAALFQLNWDSGNNANMRMKSIPASAQDLSRYHAVEIVIKLDNDSMGYDRPSEPTRVRLALQGGPDDSIWQTNTDSIQTFSGDGYKTLVFYLSDSEMSRESGSSSLSETLSQAANLRLRFENEKSANAREDAYISSIKAVDK